jgi:hypothetical protein
METFLYFKVSVDLLIYFEILAPSGRHLRLKILELDEPYFEDFDENFADNFRSEVKDGILAGLWSIGISRSASLWMAREDIHVFLVIHIYQIGQNSGLFPEIKYVDDFYEPGVYQPLTDISHPSSVWNYSSRNSPLYYW